ncbi:MAG: DmsE family decaheme c-type cytochrome [Gammaproteobacteria bacterium]|nr:DmsE family decaheme c-type cytochrome [Gammaproteobacteria bacterium]
MDFKTIRRMAIQLGAGMLLCSAALAQSSDEAQIPYSRAGADTCLPCHLTNQTVLAIFQTKHAVPTDPHGPFGEGQLQCEACHGPGGAHTGGVPGGQERPAVIRFTADSAASVETQNGICLGCHEGDAGFSWHGGAHDDNEISCAGCHQVHAANDAVLRTSTQADKCYDCHAFRKSDSLKAYSHPLREGKMACTECHSPHGATTELLLNRQTVNATCYQCHAEKRGPFLWEHAPVPEDCLNCHNPHGSNHAGMLEKRAPLLCQSCHSQSGHPSVAYDAGGLASGTPSPYLLAESCLNCHSQVHGSNHPSGSKLMR